MLNLAIDRIIDTKPTEKFFTDSLNFDADEYFKDVIGVTVNHEQKAKDVVLFVAHKHAPYVMTKPFHPSQKLIDKNSYGITISLKVRHNFELEKEILGLGDGITVISPDRLRSNIQNRLEIASESYNASISERGIASLKTKFQKSGFCAVSRFYPKKKIGKLGQDIHKNLHDNDNPDKPTIINLSENTYLDMLLESPFTKRVLEQLLGEYGVMKVTYHERIPEELCTFKQMGDYSSAEIIIPLSQQKSREFIVQVIPGSFKKQHSEDDIKLIVGNCMPTPCRLEVGGAVILNSAVIRSLPDYFEDSAVRFILIDVKVKS